MSDKPKILCVDDEENILKAIQRSLRKPFDIHIANSGSAGLEVMRKDGPFDVVISDMKMPEMNGAQFLRLVREEFPDTVRMLLTGFADLDTVVTAVNEGYIYRFIAKPCSAGVLLEAIEGAVRQHQLITAERVLLEQTLRGSISALTNILALASPMAFGRATRLRQLGGMLVRETEEGELWLVEVAAMLSQIGCITLPEETAVRLYKGQELNEAEQAMVSRMPGITQNILGKIPRLEPVMEILKYMGKNYDGTGEPEDNILGEDIPMGARILKMANRCEELQTAGESPGRIMDHLRAEPGYYDPQLLKAFEKIASRGDVRDTVRGVTLQELRTGMIFTDEVKSKTGVLLVAEGQEVTVSLLARIQNYNETTGLQTPLWVMNRQDTNGE